MLLRGGVLVKDCLGRKRLGRLSWSLPSRGRDSWDKGGGARGPSGARELGVLIHRCHRLREFYLFLHHDRARSPRNGGLADSAPRPPWRVDVVHLHTGELDDAGAPPGPIHLQTPEKDDVYRW